MFLHTRTVALGGGVVPRRLLTVLPTPYSFAGLGNASLTIFLFVHEQGGGTAALEKR